jgi:glycyl-tRNA synthetase beta chain
MTEMRAETLLVELLTEELPPKALKAMGDAFAAGIKTGLVERGLVDEGVEPTAYATPRRLSVSIAAVRHEAYDSEVVERLMPAATAADASGKPTTALRKRLEKIGRGHLADGYPDAWDGPDHLYVASDGKADYVWFRSLAKGQALVVGLQSTLEDTLEKLPMPQVMSYQRNGATIKFARPAHRLVALHGLDVVHVTALGLNAGQTTAGHRFMGRAELNITAAGAYAPTLEAEGKVLPSFAKRRQKIFSELDLAAAGANVIMSDALLDEVTALVEWPKIYTGGFDPAFLEVPQECLILTMQRNQRYFALADPDGRLQSRFLLVSNIETHDPGQIIRGNERVLRARLADAKFFFDQDRKQPLAARVPKLARVVYHNKLGSQLGRVERVRAIARHIAERIDADPELVDRAAYLAKADLLTDMVGEFPELQGLMGRHYAIHDGEPSAVAEAIGAQYLLRQDESEWAANLPGAVLSAADRTETLVGMYGIGLIPTGEKDPHGLRRAALALISVFEAFGAIARVQDKPVRLTLRGLLESAAATFPAEKLSKTVVVDLEGFIFERYRNQLAQGFDRAVVDSVIDQRPPLHEVVARVNAVQDFRQLPEAEALAAANKRVMNILRKSGADALPALERSRLVEGAEKDLCTAIEKLLPIVHQHATRSEFTKALRALSSIRQPVDRFFEEVLVMDEDRTLRGNRLALLRGLSEAMNQVADISKLAS